jgi:dihydrofolate reductase
MDWLHFSRDVQQYVATYWASIDTMLMGRKTWEVAVGQGGGGGGGGMKGITTHVFSRTLDHVGHGAHLVREDAGEFVRRLKEQPGMGICVMGGGELAQSLFTAGVIDEVASTCTRSCWVPACRFSETRAAVFHSFWQSRE